MTLRDHLQLLSCPNDGSPLALSGSGGLHCAGCGARFPLLENDLVELMPSQFPSWGAQEDGSALAKVEQAYHGIFMIKFAWIENPVGWGSFSTASAGYRAFVNEEFKLILKLLAPSPTAIAVDVSGGVGNYSVPLAGHVAAMFHCELDPESIQAAYRRGARKNMVFIRTPYLKLPFRSGSVDHVICTDTLIRGPEHELRLLSEITRILKKGGRAVVDLHNSPLFFSNKAVYSYTSGRLRSLLEDAHIDSYELFPFGHIPLALVPNDPLFRLLNRLCGGVIPCQRHVVTFIK